MINNYILPVKIADVYIPIKETDYPKLSIFSIVLYYAQNEAVSVCVLSCTLKMKLYMRRNFRQIGQKMKKL